MGEVSHDRRKRRKKKYVPAAVAHAWRWRCCGERGGSEVYGVEKMKLNEDTKVSKESVVSRKSV